MIVSIAEEMNPTRRNTMEDVHVAMRPGSWGAPAVSATFLGVYDGHGGRLIADYLGDHLAENVAKEWKNSESESRKKEKSVNDGAGGMSQLTKKRRTGDKDQENNDNQKSQSIKSKLDNEKEEEIMQTALERAFLLTDMQSRMDGITTSGATVVCCVVIPKFSSYGNLSSISVHAANAGDARAVLSSSIALPLNKVQSKSNKPNSKSTTAVKQFSKNSKKALPNPELPNELLPFNNRHSTRAIRITHDHKSTDPKEIARIEAAGGIMIRGRVLGVLAVARSLGDHGLKEYVIGRPYLSSTVVEIVDDNEEYSDYDGNGNDGNNNDAEGKSYGKNELSQSLAKNKASSPPFTNGEFLIVACDGFWDVMEDQEAVDFVRNHVFNVHNHNGQQQQQHQSSSTSLRKKKEEDVASFLIEEALRRRSTDNITVIVYWL